MALLSCSEPASANINFFLFITLRAGHPVSCSCVFVLVCLVRVRGDLFSFLKFFGWCAIHMYFHGLPSYIIFLVEYTLVSGRSTVSHVTHSFESGMEYRRCCTTILFRQRNFKLVVQNKFMMSSHGCG